ncbi:MAG: terminase family protein, partial [Clostridia bacterium]|nr:terminase family protein [Clostridia bacterium]
EALYGGAAGGGKSDALIIEALRQVHLPHYKALILRKTYPQLRELVDKTLNYYPRAFPDARYNAGTHTWSFGSGARIIFGAMQYTRDRVKYQGQAFDFIAFDELTHFSWDEYSYLFSRNRPNGPGTRCYIRATANPGGVGHGWVKERFITAAPPLTPIEEAVSWHTPDGRQVQRVQKRIFVPSSVFDNPALLGNDPNYVQRLAALPEAERKALLYGDWNSFSGQVFCEWRDDPKHYLDRLNTHVIAPFALPEGWKIYRGLDWGYSKPFSVGWYALDFDGRLYRVREYYGCTDSPNTGVRLEPSAVAREIKRIEQEDPNLRGRNIIGVADPAIWGSDGTESIAGLMEREKVFFTRGDHARIDGKMQVHNRLTFDKNGVPMLYVFSTCRHFIRTLPALCYDSVRVEDIDSSGEDHIYDELRYVCMENPIRSPATCAPKRGGWDPLNGETVTYQPYDWYKNY